MVAGRPAALGKPDRGGQKVPFYATPYPYLGLLGLLLAGTYAWGRSDPLGMLAFACVALLYALVVQILVIIAAFQEGTGRGFLAMCLPFYGIYFVFRVQESDTLKLLYGIAIAINIIVRIVMESAKG
jgi:hypothetical protein